MSAAAKIVIGCRLPNGLVIEMPNKPDPNGYLTPTPRENRVALKGKNRAVIVGADYGLTEVDVEFWAAWKKANPKFPALAAGTIFEASSANDAAAVADEVKAERTGFEPMQIDGKDPRAAGVIPAQKDD